MENVSYVMIGSWYSASLWVVFILSWVCQCVCLMDCSNYHNENSLCVAYQKREDPLFLLLHFICKINFSNSPNN